MDGLRRCPICGSLPWISTQESPPKMVRFYCHTHQYIHTDWYPLYKKAEEEWVNAGFIADHGLACKCPKCNETPVIAEDVWHDENPRYTVACRRHGQLLTEFYESPDIALEKWNAYVREAMTPKSPNTVSTIAFTNEDHDKFISFLSEEV